MNKNHSFIQTHIHIHKHTKHLLSAYSLISKIGHNLRKYLDRAGGTP